MHLQCRRPRFDSWVWKIPWRRDRLRTLVYLGFPTGSAGKESACNEGDLGLIPRLGKSPGKGKGYSFYYSGLENSMTCTAKHRTQVSLRFTSCTFIYAHIFFFRDPVVEHLSAHQYLRTIYYFSTSVILCVWVCVWVRWWGWGKLWSVISNSLLVYGL